MLDQNNTPTDTTKQDGGSLVDHDEFLQALFPDVNDGAHIMVARQKSGKGGFLHAKYPGKALGRWMMDSRPSDIYFTVSTVRETPEEPYQMRRKSDCVSARVVILDDIGTKAEAPPVEPTYKLESSENNFQWGYRIHPYTDLARFDAIIDAVTARGYGDEGAEGCNRVMRLPGSVNTKPERNGFVSRVTDWHSDRVWGIDDLIAELGISPDELKIETGNTAPRASVGGAAAAETRVIDPILTWLAENDHIVKDSGGQWVNILCPWHGEHTTGDGGTDYSPLGRGTGGWEERRAFNCLHEHCQDRTFKDFRDWVMASGGPWAAGHDPLPWLQARWVYVDASCQFADMEQRPRGGVWLYSEKAWTNMFPHRVTVQGHDNPVATRTAFLESRETTRAADLKYLPNGNEIAERYEQQFVNTWVPPQHAETDEAPQVFLDHMDYLLPVDVERECFLDWLAFKLQNPDVRSYAVVLVADEAYGVGRSWLGKALHKVTCGQTGKVSLKQLIGKGTQAEQNYNDWSVGVQFIIVNEAKDVDRLDFFKSYETFKDRVDTSSAEERINPKYGPTRNEEMFWNALIFSNHADAIALPDDDRRVAVFTNPTEKRNSEYYTRLWASLDGDEPARAYWWLLWRDVSSFDHAAPPMTPAKQKMLEMTRSPSDEIMDWLEENAKGDIVTRRSLEKMVRKAARDLGHEKIEVSPSGVSNYIWKSIGTLRPDAKNGARYLIDSTREEVRAHRNWGKWGAVDAKRDRDAIVSELEKNTGQPAQFAMVS